MYNFSKSCTVLEGSSCLITNIYSSGKNSILSDKILDYQGNSVCDWLMLPKSHEMLTIQWQWNVYQKVCYKLQLHKVMYSVFPTFDLPNWRIRYDNNEYKCHGRIMLNGLAPLTEKPMWVSTSYISKTAEWLKGRTFHKFDCIHGPDRTRWLNWWSVHLECGKWCVRS